MNATLSDKLDLVQDHVEADILDDREAREQVFNARNVEDLRPMVSRRVDAKIVKLGCGWVDLNTKRDVTTGTMELVWQALKVREADES